MIDLKQEITLDTLKDLPRSVSASRVAKGPLPSKTTINLAQMNASSENRVFAIVAFVAALALILIGCKFLVVDQLAEGYASAREVSVAKEQLAELETANADYAAVSAEYAKYVVAGLSAEERSLVNRGTVTSLVREKLLSAGDVRSITVSGNVLTCVVGNVSLDKASAIVKELNAVAGVSHATVSGAQGDDAATSDVSSVTFVVTFGGSNATDDADTPKAGE